MSLFINKMWNCEIEVYFSLLSLYNTFSAFYSQSLYSRSWESAGIIQTQWKVVLRLLYVSEHDDVNFLCASFSDSLTPVGNKRSVLKVNGFDFRLSQSNATDLP